GPCVPDRPAGAQARLRAVRDDKREASARPNAIAPPVRALKGEGGPRGAHSALMSAALTTAPQRSRSVARKAANAAGEPACGSTASRPNADSISADLRGPFTAALRLAAISGGR